MIEKEAKRNRLEADDDQQRLDDLKYWLSRPSAERVAEVERLRRMVHGESRPVERVARVVDMKTGKVIREYTGKHPEREE